MGKLWTWRKFLYSLVGFCFVFFACSFIGLLIIGTVLGLCFLLQYNIFIGLGAVIGVASLGMTIVIMKEN